MLAEILQSEGSQGMEFDGFHFVPFCKVEVPKMWKNYRVF